jgi:hypothetical protein
MTGKASSPRMPTVSSRPEELFDEHLRAELKQS